MTALQYESPIYYNPESYSPATLAGAREHKITFRDAIQPGSEDERQEEWRKHGGVAYRSSTDGSDSELEKGSTRRSTDDSESDFEKSSMRRGKDLG